MTIVPLKLRLSLYAAGLAVAIVALAAAVVPPFVYRHELQLLDKRLTLRADELFSHLEAVEGGAAFRENLTDASRYIPVVMRNFYVQLDESNGSVRWRTANLGEQDLKKSGAQFQNYTFVGKSIRAGAFPKKGFTLHVGTDLNDLETMQNQLDTGAYILLPLLAITGAVSGWLLGHRALRPVAKITAAAESISAEHLDQRLPVPSARDDIRRLTNVLNTTFDRLQRSFEQAYRFSADASHQLKTPIAVLRAELDALMKSDDLSANDRSIVNEMLNQTQRLTNVIEDLLLLAQADAGRLKVSAEPIDVVPLIEASLDDFSGPAEERSIQFQKEMPGKLTARVDSRRFGHLLQNLVENAVKFSAPGGQIRVSARRDGPWAAVTIANTGAPIPAGSQSKIFERFHRAEKAEEVAGHGLGLNIALELAKAHGGELRLLRSDAERTEFELRIPAGPRTDFDSPV